MSDATEFRDRALSLGLARVAEQAALASAKLIGRGDEKAADQAAVNAMRTQLNLLDIAGVVVIGEGERDEAPMLYIGEEVGSGNGPAVDIALDPLEGTTLTAKDMPNALTVIAMGPRGSMLHAPDVYMEKLAVGPGLPENVVSLTMDPATRVMALATAKNCAPENITVCVLERPRHEAMIAELRTTSCAIRLITDGDIFAAIAAASSEVGVDVLMGIGGTPEGVVAAAALKAMGGQILGRLHPRNDEEKKAAIALGYDLSKVLTINDLVSGDDAFFAATGLTDGELLRGVRYDAYGARSHSLVMRSRSGTIRYIETHHRHDRLSAYSSDTTK